MTKLKSFVTFKKKKPALETSARLRKRVKGFKAKVVKTKKGFTVFTQ